VRFGVATVAVLLVIASAAVRPASADTHVYVFFKNGVAFCIAYDPTKANGYVVCSARIGGALRSVFLRGSGIVRFLGSGDTLKLRAAVPPSKYGGLGTPWRSGPFVCSVAAGGVTCATTSSHGFTINGSGISTR
jgi:hypothetical protein